MARGLCIMPMSEARKRANAKWNSQNVEQVSIKLYVSRNDPKLEQIKAAADRDGMSVNVWIVEAIKDKL